MSDDLVKRLLEGVIERPKRWTGDTHDDLGGSVDCDATDALMMQAADRIEELSAALQLLLGAHIDWYSAEDAEMFQKLTGQLRETT